MVVILKITGGVCDDLGSYRSVAVKVRGETWEEVHGTVEAWARKNFKDWNNISYVPRAEWFGVSMKSNPSAMMFVAGKPSQGVKHNFIVTNE